MTFRMSN